jgi:GNAT superfamily N-acetyltransferase
MSPAWTLRPGRATDAHAIAATTLRAWRHAYRGILPSVVLDGLELASRRERWRERLASQGEGWRVIVAERAGVVGGFVGFGPGADHPQRPALPEHGEILALYLEPSLFGSGLADTLAAGAEAWLATHFEASFLWVLEDNARARAFYARRGWRPDGARAPYTRVGCEGVELLRYRLERG